MGWGGKLVSIAHIILSPTFLVYLLGQEVDEEETVLCVVLEVGARGR